jgi:prepilin signal peptidase PulO-like enzyme (type II secretory pathway)
MFEFISWLIILTGLIALFIYDFKWMLLPNAIVYSLIVIALVRLVALLLLTNNLDILYGAFWGVLVLFGLFYLLFQISGGKWIGGGDVKLAILLGILVGGPLMSMLLLFIASLLGTIYALPLVIKGKVRQHKVIPFGPFLITATIVVMLFGVQIINWYKIGLGV